jgi:hypothetical protein
MMIVGRRIDEKTDQGSVAAPGSMSGCALRDGGSVRRCAYPREDIYRADRDRQLFLRVLADVCERFNWWGHAYCLMTNHYHLLMETPDANLANGMRQLSIMVTVYSIHSFFLALVPLQGQAQ